MSENNIKQFVQNLPEIYQRIYGHPEFDDTSRLCSDREKYITRVVESLQNQLGKKELNILDIGCAQGYFSLSLAAIGCKVTGLDFCKENIELCRALNDDNKFDCNFKFEKLTYEFVDEIKNDEFDVVLLLSVIHHVCNEGGFDYARNIFETLAAKSSILITELAVKDEPLYWNKNLPADYDRWFDNVKFFDELTFFPTHLSDISRPLIICSDKYFYCENSFFEFTEYKTSAYDLKQDDLSRRYFLNDNMLMKLYRGKKKYFFNEIENEKEFCEKYNFSFAPKLLSFQKENRSILAVYEIKKGDRLLIDAVKNNEKLDFKKIFSDILENLIELEKSNLYPGDLRSWNICLKNNDAFLIDFGDLKSSTEDSVANLFNKNLNFTVHDSFITLIYDCLTGNTYNTIKDFELYSLTAFFDETKIEKKYANLFKSYFLLNKKDISFSEIKTLFESFVISENEVSFSQDENIRILAELQNRLFKQKADYVDLKIQELKIRNIENYQRNRDSFFNNKLAEHNAVIGSVSKKLDSHSEKHPYILNTNLIAQNTLGVTLKNFHECEPGGIWTSANKSKITINGNDIFYSEFSKKLRFRCHSIIGGGAARILWNGSLLGEMEISESAETFEFELKNEICGRNQNVLEIEYNGSITTPAELGLNENTRKLGLYFEYIYVCTDLSQRISALDRKLLETENRMSETDKILAQQLALNEQLHKRIDELNGLILNTRHRTLYGACAWVFRKVFRRK